MDRPADFRAPTGALLVIVDGDETVAGGALRRWDDGIGEIKRMWTSPEHRRRGHARRILAALEDVALGYGYRALRLETGIYQAEAIGLCLSAGYHPVGDDERCVSFAKRLASA